MNQEDSPISARVRARFPDHQVALSFQICLPVYELRVRVTVLAEHKLSTVARFVLQLVALGVSRPSDIHAYLGLPDALVPDVASELLQQQLVIQRADDDSIEITERGREVLANNGISMRPQNRHPRLPYDPLTRRIAHIDVKDVVDRSVVAQQGLYIAPTRPRRPKPNQIQFEDIRRYCNTHDTVRLGGEILGVVDIKDYRLKYRQDVRVFKLTNDVTPNPKYAAYRDIHYLEEESAALQRLADGGSDLTPAEFEELDSVRLLGSTSVSKDEFRLLKAIRDTDRDLNINAGGPAGTPTAARANQLRERLRKDTEGHFGLVETEEHRSLLLKAIQQAQSQLTLVSAWIHPRAFDDEVVETLCAAIARGVSVRIAWGFGTTRRAEKARNRIAAQNALKHLRGRIRAKDRGRLVEKRTETHEKYIICDASFCAFGSFNWLSYRGELDDHYRREVSYYTEREEDIRLFRNRSDELFREVAS